MIFCGTQRAILRRDVRIVGQKIDQIAKDFQAAPGDIVDDTSGRILSPGLIDMHVHAYHHGHLLSLDVDTVAATSGTTTFVDAGTCGILQFTAFREYVIKRARSRIFAEQTYQAGSLLDPAAASAEQEFPAFMDKAIPWKNYGNGA